jgi:hypothetical protein
VRCIPFVSLVIAGVLLVAAAPAQAAVPDSCPGAPIEPTRTITGSFSTEQQGSYVELPFDVPAGTTQVRVKYCWDRPESPDAPRNHTLDLGIYGPLDRGETIWGPDEFIGWGGSSHPDVAISVQGFSSEAEYLRNPRGYIPGRTTRGFNPTRIRPGRWAVELGVAAVIPASAGDATGHVDYRVDIELSRDPAFTRSPYRRTPYNPGPVRRRPGWYAGDFHVHAEHSALGDATMAETFRYAFGPASRGRAGLDFTALSDYVTDSAWGEIGRYQRRYPNNLIIPSSEIITYRGHLANQGSRHYVDYRTGPILERRDDGSLVRLRGPVPPKRKFGQIQGFGGFTVINHPRIFPPTSPEQAAFCRGCYWSYTDPETDLSRVNAIEVMNSLQSLDEARTTPNPFTVPAIEFWQRALAAGHRIAAIGGSDSHHAGETPEAFQSPVGKPATMVYARELSMKGVLDAVKTGHTYVKAFGVTGPDLRLTARRIGRADGGRRRAIMGDEIRGPVVIDAAATRTRGNVQRVFELQRNGVTIRRIPVTGTRTGVRLRTARPGRYGVVLWRGQIVEAISSPIYVRPAGASEQRPIGVTG